MLKNLFRRGQNLEEPVHNHVAQASLAKKAPSGLRSLCGSVGKQQDIFALMQTNQPFLYSMSWNAPTTPDCIQKLGTPDSGDTKIAGGWPGRAVGQLSSKVNTNKERYKRFTL